MSNLLDKASIILTPTAYNNGEALCVKPSDGSGDFDFSRNSAATRVNAQGLVENVQILSSNLVQNGSFSEEGVQEVSNGSFSQEGAELLSQPVNLVNDFTTNSGGVIVDADTFTTSGGAVDGIKKLSFLTVGKSYKLIIEGDTTSSGFTLGILVNGNEYGSGFGTHYFKATTQDLWVRQQTSGTTNITSFSVREVGQDWEFSGGAELTEQGARINNTITGANAFIKQVNSNLTIGKSIVFQYDVVETNGKNLAIEQISGNLSLNTSTIGNNRKVYFEFDRADASLIIKRAAAATDVTITNISVKEVGQNWVLFSGWSIGNNKVIGDGTAFSNIEQTPILIQNKKVKLTFDILDYVSGTFRLIPTDRQDGLDERYSGNGSYEVIYTSTVPYLRLQQQVFNGSITNISVIEITDDTNLPRINYEGFSYQDALGSEEVVNGSFDTDSDWSKSGSVTIGNGKANFDIVSGGFTRISQNISLTNGKTYKINLEVNTQDAGKQIFIRDTSSGDLGGLQQLINLVDGVTSYIYYFTANANSNAVYIKRQTASGDYSFSIDNVSVKEYLGQEVVPDSGCGSWLWEPQSTNLITQSNAFDTQTKVNVTVTSNAIISPDGTLNADKLVENSANSQHYLRVNTSSSNPSVISVFAKKGEETKIFIGNASFSQGVLFDLNLGVIESGSNGTIEDFGNGWYRCSFYRIDLSAWQYISLRGNFTTYQGNGVNGVYLYGLQLEEQSYATSYIPTSGSTVTRNQDVCTNGGSLASINSTEGVLYAEIAALANDGTVRYLGLNDGSSNNRVVLLYHNSNNNIRAIISSGGTKFVDVNSSVTSSLDFHKVAIKYKSNDFALWIDGVEVATETSLNAPIGLNSLDFLLSGANNFFGKTKAVAVWKEALSDAELAELTTI